VNISQYREQISAVIASPKIDQYLVGITANLDQRRKAYIGEKFPILLVLEINLDKAAAINLERNLFKGLVEKKRSRFYSKYHREKRDSPYRNSTGGQSGEAYCVYLAAFGP